MMIALTRMINKMTEVFIGLGGNMGDVCATLQHALRLIARLEQVWLTGVSRFYLTTPVSDIPQDPYTNAVCRCNTTLSAPELLKKLQHIEKLLGKVPIEKNAPRPIDLDILFFGSERYDSPTLKIPHPRWKERLFVLRPLADLTSEISIPNADGSGHKRFNLLEYLKTFPNPHQETVRILNYGFSPNQ